MGKNTKERILKTGVEMWLENPSSVNAHAIACRMGMSHGTIFYHFPENIKDVVANHAVKEKIIPIIRQLITSNHKSVDGLSDKLKKKYLNDFKSHT